MPTTLHIYVASAWCLKSTHTSYPAIENVQNKAATPPFLQSNSVQSLTSLNLLETYVINRAVPLVMWQWSHCIAPTSRCITEEKGRDFDLLQFPVLAASADIGVQHMTTSLEIPERLVRSTIQHHIVSIRLLGNINYLHSTEGSRELVGQAQIEYVCMGNGTTLKLPLQSASTG